MSWFRRLNFAALLLCFVVIVFGAFVRLSNAGLGCPDWPGCYGHLTVTAAQQDSSAGLNYPSRPTVEAPKAWKEMIHRYLVMALSTLLLALVILAWSVPALAGLRWQSLALIAIIAVQAELGRLTVLWKVNPVTVTGHLLVGLSTLAVLWWLWLRSHVIADPATHEPPIRLPAAPAGLRGFAALALALLAGQIFLGGWTSSNYAALACPDFPACLGSFSPATPLADAFAIWHGTGANYEFGVLDAAARATIHLLHRYGALLVSLALSALAIWLLRQARAALWRRLAIALATALLLQVSIGISIVELGFPLWLADAHNAGAALLVLVLVALNFFAWQSAGQPRQA